MIQFREKKFNVTLQQCDKNKIIQTVKSTVTPKFNKKYVPVDNSGGRISRISQIVNNLKS